MSGECFGGGWWLLTRNLERTSRPGVFEGETLAVFQSAWARENAISTMINVYRSGFRREPLPDDGRPPVPVRYVFGGRDAYMPRTASELTAEILGADAAVERARGQPLAAARGAGAGGCADDRVLRCGALTP